MFDHLIADFHNPVFKFSLWYVTIHNIIILTIMGIVYLKEKRGNNK